MPPYITRTTQLIVVPTGEPVFSELATTVTLVDEAAGEFVEVCQVARTDVGKICISAEEWPKLREAINKMIKKCRD